MKGHIKLTKIEWTKEERFAYSTLMASMGHGYLLTCKHPRIRNYFTASKAMSKFVMNKLEYLEEGE